jgi:hypothetical protein
VERCGEILHVLTRCGEILHVLTSNEAYSRFLRCGESSACLDEDEAYWIFSGLAKSWSPQETQGAKRVWALLHGVTSQRYYCTLFNGVSVEHGSDRYA